MSRPVAPKKARARAKHLQLRCTQDNVLVLLEPLDAELKSKFIITSMRRTADEKQVRFARVINSGPGYYAQRRIPASGTLGEHTETTGVFVPNVTKKGDRVLVDHNAGNHWDMNTAAPRHNKQTGFTAIGDMIGELRIVREDEILAIVGD